MYELQIPPDGQAFNVEGKLVPLSFRRFIGDVILPRPYWRTPEGVMFYDDLVALVDGTNPKEMLSDAFKEKLEIEMRLPADQLNPMMARSAIRFARAVFLAQKVVADSSIIDGAKPALPSSG